MDNSKTCKRKVYLSHESLVLVVIRKLRQNYEKKLSKLDLPLHKT